ncbi:MAG: hypothetical protein AAF533_07585 [Acidobacteriota bacterium]
MKHSQSRLFSRLASGLAAAVLLFTITACGSSSRLTGVGAPVGGGGTGTGLGVLALNLDVTDADTANFAGATACTGGDDSACVEAAGGTIDFEFSGLDDGRLRTLTIEGIPDALGAYTLGTQAGMMATYREEVSAGVFETYTCDGSDCGDIDVEPDFLGSGDTFVEVQIDLAASGFVAGGTIRVRLNGSFRFTPPSTGGGGTGGGGGGGGGGGAAGGGQIVADISGDESLGYDTGDAPCSSTGFPTVCVSALTETTISFAGGIFTGGRTRQFNFANVNISSGMVGVAQNVALVGGPIINYSSGASPTDIDTYQCMSLGSCGNVTVTAVSATEVTGTFSLDLAALALPFAPELGDDPIGEEGQGSGVSIRNGTFTLDISDI